MSKSVSGLMVLLDGMPSPERRSRGRGALSNRRLRALPRRHLAFGLRSRARLVLGRVKQQVVGVVPQHQIRDLLDAVEANAVLLYQVLQLTLQSFHWVSTSLGSIL